MNDDSSSSETGLDDSQMWMLMQPLHPSRVSHRSQGGANLAYVEAYDIKATLIRIFGFGGFSAEVSDAKILAIREHETTPSHHKRDGTAKTPEVIAQSTVTLTIFGLGPDGQDVRYTETAVGSNSGYDIGDVADNAIKSASSDALKRCAIYLGTQFGLGLYNQGSTKEIVAQIIEQRQREQWQRVTQPQQEFAPDQSTQALLDGATQAVDQVQAEVQAEVQA